MSENLNPISLLRSKLSNSENKTVFNNFISLFILQLMNYALPLIILPYLTQKLGPANYGKVAWAQYAIQYLVFFTDYGFQFSANRLISISRNDSKEVNKIFNSVMFIKFIMMLIAYLILFIWMNVSEFSVGDRTILNITFLMVIGAVFMPVWLFQGMERMKWNTIINVLVKVILVFAVFIFISGKNDIVTTAWLLAGANAFAGLICFITAIRIFKIKLFFPELKDVIFQFKEGWLVFITTLFTSIYVTSNGFLLGEMSGDVSLGYYTPAEKIVRAVTSFFNPVMLALYPFISKKFVENKTEATRLFFKLFKQISIFTFIASVILFLVAPLTDDFLGAEYTKSISVIQWLAFIPFFGTAGALLSYHLFLNSGMKKLLPWIMFGLCILDIVLCYYWIPLYSQNGAAMAIMAVEAAAPVVYLGVYYFIAKEKI